jgi:membrane peptidoglycan carboxypeptidase
MLSDNNARTPTYGADSALNFRDRPVAVKTGTTNDYHDVWVVGYTPSVDSGI